MFKFKANHFILAVAAVFSMHAPNANAAVVSVAAEITVLIVRDYGIHVGIKLLPGSAPLAGLQCTNPNALTAPIFLPSNTNYKAYKDAVMLAFALKRPITVHFDSTAPCFSDYPLIIGIDVG